MAKEPDEVGRSMHAGSDVGEVEDRELVVSGEGVSDRLGRFTKQEVVDADGEEIGELSRCEGDVCIITPTPGVWERLTEKYGTERLAVSADDLETSGDHLTLTWTLDEVLQMEYEGGAGEGGGASGEGTQYGDETFKG